MIGSAAGLESERDLDTASSQEVDRFANHDLLAANNAPLLVVHHQHFHVTQLTDTVPVAPCLDRPIATTRTAPKAESI